MQNHSFIEKLKHGLGLPSQYRSQQEIAEINSIATQSAAGKQVYYYCVDNQTVQGPITKKTLCDLFRCKAVPETTLVSTGDKGEWLTISAILPQKSDTRSFFGTPVQWSCAGGVLLLLIIALGFTHLVFGDSGLVAIVPKKGFSYAMTFVSVDDLLNRYNNRSLGSALRGDPDLEYLVEELSRKDVISLRKKSWQEIESDVRKSLPDK